MKTPEIILENRDLIIVKKPAGMASETARVAETDLVTWLRNYRVRHLDPHAGEKGRPSAEIHLIERLDQPVEGLLLAAKSREAAAELTRMQQAHNIRKTYQAVVTGPMPGFDAGDDNGHVRRTSDAGGADPDAVYRDGPYGHLLDIVRRNPRTHMAEITDPSDPKGKRAELEYRLLAVKEGGSSESTGAAAASGGGYRLLLELRLITGRYHQIRIQLSSRGYPIVGDRRYGGTPARQMELASVGVTFSWRGQRIKAEYTPEFLTTEGFPSKMA